LQGKALCRNDRAWKKPLGEKQMGYTYGFKASEVLLRWSNACVANSGSQNTWQEPNGKKYFFENSRRQRDDYGISGTIWRFISETHVRKSGSFLIAEDGTIVRAPKFLKNA